MVSTISRSAFIALITRFISGCRTLSTATQCVSFGHRRDIKCWGYSKQCVAVGNIELPFREEMTDNRPIHCDLTFLALKVERNLPTPLPCTFQLFTSLEL